MSSLAMAEAAIPSIEELSKLKMKELKEMCKKDGLFVTGSKKELAERLHSHYLKAAEDSLLNETLNEDEPVVVPALPKVSKPKAQTSQLPPKAPKQPTAAADNSQKVISGTSLQTTENGDTACSSSRVPVMAPEADKAEVSLDEKRKLRAERFGSTIVTTDAEMEDLKKKRADRFGFSYVDPKTTTSQGSSALAGASVAPGDVDRMKKRAERFGEVIAPVLKSGDPVVVDDPEKLSARAKRFNIPTESEGTEKKKMRAERFNIPSTEADVEKMKARAARFSTVTA